MKTTYFYKDKPLFGFELGFDRLRVMQINERGGEQVVSGYGTIKFPSSSIHNGIIQDPQAIAKAAIELFSKQIKGEITTRRVVVSVPAARTFSRTMRIPKLKSNEIAEAVSLEAEQYIPVPVGDLYMDHMVFKQTNKEIELLAVAAPKRIVDSYMALTDLLNLEVVGVETSINASSRLFMHAEPSNLPTVLIDFGNLSSDITIYDQALLVTGTVKGGGESFTEVIAKALRMSHDEAQIIKTKYGLGTSKKQKQISAAVSPLLDQLIKEVRRLIRYYEDRSETKRKIEQIVTLGGGANMPGLSEYMTSTMRMPVRMCDPWQNLSFEKLQKPTGDEKPSYTTVAGLALINPKELFS